MAVPSTTPSQAVNQNGHDVKGNVALNWGGPGEEPQTTTATSPALPPDTATN